MASPTDATAIKGGGKTSPVVPEEPPAWRSFCRKLEESGLSLATVENNFETLRRAYFSDNTVPVERNSEFWRQNGRGEASQGGIIDLMTGIGTHTTESVSISRVLLNSPKI